MGLVRAARPKQWIKNLLVAAPAVAAGLIDDHHDLLRVSVAFVSMCLVASAGYFLNDVIDVEADRRHPTKRRRPVAAGVVTEPVALVSAFVLGGAGVGVGWPLGVGFVVVILVYLVTAVFYTLWLQRIPVIDLAVVASFFVLRTLAGGEALHVRLSPSFLILVSSAALFAVAGKRYGDLQIAQPDEDAERDPELEGETMYSMSFLRFVWTVAAVGAIGAYCFWAFTQPHVHYGVSWSEVSIAPFVLAVLRYAQVIDAGDAGAPEEVVLHDRPLQLIILIWAVVYGLGIYLHG